MQEWEERQAEGTACAKAWRAQRPTQPKHRVESEDHGREGLGWEPLQGFRQGVPCCLVTDWLTDHPGCALLWLGSCCPHSCSEWQTFGALRMLGAREPAGLGPQGCGPGARSAPSAWGLPAAGRGPRLKGRVDQACLQRLLLLL